MKKSKKTAILSMGGKKQRYKAVTQSKSMPISMSIPEYNISKIKNIRVKAEPSEALNYVTKQVDIRNAAKKLRKASGNTNATRKAKMILSRVKATKYI